MLRQLVKFQTRVAGLQDERGATAVEYALMVTLIAVVIVGGVTVFGSAVNSLFASADSGW